MGKVLVNPGGRVVEIDDPEQIVELLEKRGFREANATEEGEYRRARKQLVESLEPQPLHRDGVRVYFKSVRSGADGYGMSRGLLVSELRELGVLMEENYDEQKIGLLYAYPYSILQMENDIRVIFTMFESDKIPADWPDYLNQADRVLVPSTFVKETMKRAGVEAEVVPLGYNDRVFKPIKRTPKLDKNQDFTFIHYNAFNIRKGFREVLDAFSQEFKHHEPVKLILKTTLNAPVIPLPKSVYPNIEVICGQVSESELAKLLRQADCFVYPSRGEGFGITPLEAMATGMPAIVPNAHGISEYFNPKYMWEVKVKETCPALYNRFKGEDVGNMVVCDIDDLRKKMRYAFNHQKEAVELGRKAAKYVQQYSYRKTALRLKEIIDELSQTDVVRRRESEYLKVERL